MPGGEGCDGYEREAPVKSFESGASWCGALNMGSNVREWVDNWYDGYPNTSYQSDDFGTQHKVLRGGSWLDIQDVIRSTTRSDFTPDYHDIRFGFRCMSEPGG